MKKGNIAFHARAQENLVFIWKQAKIHPYVNVGSVWAMELWGVLFPSALYILDFHEPIRTALKQTTKKAKLKQRVVLVL